MAAAVMLSGASSLTYSDACSCDSGYLETVLEAVGGGLVSAFSVLFSPFAK